MTLCHSQVYPPSRFNKIGAVCSIFESRKSISLAEGVSHIKLLGYSTHGKHCPRPVNRLRDGLNCVHLKRVRVNSASSSAVYRLAEQGTSMRPRYSAVCRTEHWR